MDNNIDQYLSNYWNKNSIDFIYPENFWDYCRQLEDKGLLDSNNTAISAVSIGPFKIASNLEVSNKEFLTFFIETVVPAVFANCNNMQFTEAYSLFLLPALHIFLNLFSNSCFIKDQLQWEILLYIKQKNSENISPNISDIENEFSQIESERIKQAILKLSKLNNLLGDEYSIILKDDLGGYNSLV